jgi:thymidylate kinase
MGTDSLKSKLENMSKEEVAEWKKKYEELLKNKDRRVATVKGNNIVEQLWNGLVKKERSYEYEDEDFMKWLISQKANLGESLV